MVKLVELNIKYKYQLIEMMDEWVNSNEKIIPFSINRFDYHYFDLYLENLVKAEELKTKVPSKIYFCLDTDANKFLGAVTIRLKLTDDLLLRGGNISDGIRPSQRNKGYGTLMVNLALQKCKEFGLNKVLMVCDKNNIASAKTIIKNNGILENEIEVEDKTIQRYWINI